MTTYEMEIFVIKVNIEEESQSLRYCNARLTPDRVRASSETQSPAKNQLISNEPLAHVSDIKLIRTDTTLWS